MLPTAIIGRKCLSVNGGGADFIKLLECIHQGKHFPHGSGGEPIMIL